MPTFNIYFGHDHGISEKDIKADSLQDVMERAKLINVEDIDFVDPYQSSLDVNYIRVADDDGNELCWDHPDRSRDHAAQELFEAAEAFLISLSTGHKLMPSDLSTACNGLRRAVAKARGFCEVPVSRNAP